MDQPDELMIRRLAGAQCDGIGRTTRRIGAILCRPGERAVVVTHAVYDIFGTRPGR